MTPAQCETFIGEHCEKYPKVGEYLTDDLRVTWFESLKAIELADARKASQAIYEGREPKPYRPDEHLATILIHVRNERAAEPVRFYDGRRGYKCRWCDFDNGRVSIWNPLLIRWFLDRYIANGFDVPSDWKEDAQLAEAKKQRVRLSSGIVVRVSWGECCSVNCECTQRRQQAEERKEPFFDEDRHCVYRFGDVENLSNWLGSRSERYSEFDQFNQQEAF